MDNHDTLFNQIKSAAQNAESKEFPAMDKVWNRVEEKLDHKVLTKQHTLWKKIAVAASVLLLISIAYQFLREEKTIILPKNTTVAAPIDTASIPIDTTKEDRMVQVKTGPVSIKENADEIVQKQIHNSHTVADNESQTISPPEEAKKINEIVSLEVPTANKSLSNNASMNSYWMPESRFVARGVTHKDAELDENILPKPNQSQKHKKEEPLVVMNNLKSDKYEVSTLSDDEIESIVELQNPLYIINGVYYTEQEVFGPNPTSPYTPLNQQEIETISILQNEKAISIYGEKGKNGVVIITTKNGKPTPKKKE